LFCAVASLSHASRARQNDGSVQLRAGAARCGAAA
jgi:hypothetical protein